ncbi:hypothetical protein H8959_000432 [Pygathrix nigripes]
MVRVRQALGRGAWQWGAGGGFTVKARNPGRRASRWDLTKVVEIWWPPGGPRVLGSRGLLRQGVARPGHRRAGWQLAQGQGLLGWAPPLALVPRCRAPRPSPVLPCPSEAGRDVLSFSGFPPFSKWAPPLSHL